MINNNKRIIRYLILANIIVLVLIGSAVFLIDNNKNIIESLSFPYNIVNIFLVYISIFLPVSAGSVFFVFKLTEETQFNPGTVNSFVASLNYIIIPLFAVYSFLILYLNPVLIEKKIWLENLSETARYYQNGIIQNMERDVQKAYTFSSLYLYIDPDNEKINKINDDLYINLLGKNNYPEIKADDKNNNFVPMLLTGEKLIEISEDFLKKNDYSSAIYYSELAGKFRSSRTSSRKIIDNAENVLKQRVITDPSINILYSGKLEIEELYNRKQYIESYYRTVELKKMFPEDSELDTHKSRVLEKVREISFFYEDVENFIFVPGKENILFREKIDNNTVLINCGKIVFADNNVYMFNINTFYPETGKTWSAPFGKIIEDKLIMNCISKNKRQFYLPSGKDISLKSIPINYTGEDIINFSDEMNSIRKISILDLVTKAEVLEKGKFSETSLIIEGIYRILKCINFLMILFISVYSGLSFMKRSRGNNYLSLILFPLVLLSAAAADYLIFNFNIEIFKNLIFHTGKLKAFIIFPFLIIFEFVTSLYLTVKRSNADPE